MTQLLFFTLRNWNGQILVDLGDPHVGVYTTEWQPWSVCNIELDPGVYCMCLKNISGKVSKRSIMVSLNWQTQVFFLEKNKGLDKTE
ncbi:hypothetical protein GCM10027291_33900 [Telluribacter humicola]